MIEDTILLFRALLYYVIEDILLPRSTFYFTSKMVVACTRVYVCIRAVGYFPPVSLVFFPLLWERVTPSLSLHKLNDPSKTRLSFGYYILLSFRYYTRYWHRSLSFRFVGRIPSTFLLSPPTTPLPSSSLAR